MARRLTLGVATVAVAVGSAVAAMPASASAATANTAPTKAVAAAGCTFTSGKTSVIRQTGTGPAPFGGTLFVKGSICLDLNVTQVSAKDTYTGWLRRSNLTWFPCSKGPVPISPNPGGPVVLCSSVAAGTVMAVVQGSPTQRTITAEY
jgi:hypothetical protein